MKFKKYRPPKCTLTKRDVIIEVKFLSSHLTSSKLITQISLRGSAGKIAMAQACQQFVLLESLCQITVEC